MRLGNAVAQECTQTRAREADKQRNKAVSACGVAWSGRQQQMLCLGAVGHPCTHTICDKHADTRVRTYTNAHTHTQHAPRALAVGAARTAHRQTDTDTGGLLAPHAHRARTA